MENTMARTKANLGQMFIIFLINGRMKVLRQVSQGKN